MINKICYLISVNGVWGAKPPLAYINTKSILHQVSYFSTGEPDIYVIFSINDLIEHFITTEHNCIVLHNNNKYNLHYILYFV